MRPEGMRPVGVQFRSCKLMGVEFTALGQFPQLSFHDSTLQYASFVALSLRKTEFSGCTIGEANFFDVDLAESTFAGCDLTGSVFRGCTLRGTDFSAATGVFIDPAVNHARDAIISPGSAALLAIPLGLRVAGVSPPARAGRSRHK